jgi:hypothetical protein
MNDNKKTKTKTKTTIAAMIVITSIIASPLVVNKHAFAAIISTAGPTMLKLTTPNAPVVIPLVKGLYDGKDILLITTEVSDKAMKDQIGNFTGFPVNYDANLTKISQGIGNLWIFKNGVKGPGFMGFQASVVDSIPGDPGYTPLWKVSIAEWKTGVTPTLLGSDDAIAAAQTKGQITVTPTNVVVNCPILQWGGNKDNTIPAGHI